METELQVSLCKMLFNKYYMMDIEGLNELIVGLISDAVLRAGTDYCYVPRSNTLRIRSVSCSPEQPCDQCEGSCQNEEECSDGLTCFLRPDTSPVPNCDGTGISGRNYCFNQTLAGYDVPTLVSTECNRTQPCVECEGQCQSDSDCRGNLRCFIRPDLTPIPGCSQSFLGISGRNYCFEVRNFVDDVFLATLMATYLASLIYLFI